MNVRLASSDDVGTYIAFSRTAQAAIRARGLKQYVPAAHDEYASAIRARAESGTLYVVEDGGAAAAFFGFDTAPSQWWPADGVPAAYLAGIVVGESARGRGVGGFVIRWCAAEAGRRGRRFVRLDCHAGNPWLCRYYEQHGFVLQERIEMHPGYHGCLYQLAVTLDSDELNTT